jgi:2'-5' RNA ligase
VPRRRLGVALLLPPSVAVEVDGLRRALGDPACERIPPHLTLVPPVNVREEHVEHAITVLRRAAASTRPFTLTLGPPATFLPENPVVYLAVSGALAALRALRDAVFTPPLERKLSWPFVPHVTLADGIDPERVGAAVAVLGDYERDVTIDAVHLLEERERTWAPIADVPFGARAVIGRGGLEVELTVSERVDGEVRRWLTDEWPDPQRPLAVTARRNGAVIGVAAGWTDRELANLSELFVAPEARGEGAGGHLVAAFLSAAAERGAVRARLRTDDGSAAHRFSIHRGWTEEARYDGPAASAIVQLRRDL